MAHMLDCSGAGKHADKCKEGAERFFAQYPDEEWYIVGSTGQSGLVLMVTHGTGYARVVPVAPRLDLADSVFTALEQNRNNSE